MVKKAESKPSAGKTRTRADIYPASGEFGEVTAGLDENHEEGDGEEDNSMFEMLNILKEFQKRKATKTASSSAFQTKKSTIFAAARKNADAAVCEGVAYIEQYKAKIAQLRAQEVSQEQYLIDLSLPKRQNDAVEALLGVYSPMFDDLSYRRAEAINNASTMLETLSAKRQRSRLMLVKQAKARIDEDMENQRVATDASNLLKHYKALLLA